MKMTPISSSANLSFVLLLIRPFLSAVSVNLEISARLLRASVTCYCTWQQCHRNNVKLILTRALLFADQIKQDKQHQCFFVDTALRTDCCSDNVVSCSQLERLWRPNLPPATTGRPRSNTRTKSDGRANSQTKTKQKELNARDKNIIS